MERLQDEFGVDIVILHLNAWQFLSSALKSEKDRDIMFRLNSPGAAWRSLVDTYSLKTQGASLALLQKLDSVRIGTNDDPTLKLLEMEDIARSLRSSHSQWQHFTESYVIGKFVNALPREYDIQKQMLEEREDGFSREAVVSSVQKRFDSFAYKQLRRSKSKSGEDQAFAVTGGGKNRPGRGGSRPGSRKPGGSQGGRGNGGSGGRASSGGGASSSSSSAATAKPGGRTCWVCKSDQHYVRDCPKQICQGCGERGHYITKCGQMENAVMAVDILGRTSKDDDSDVEAYTTLEIKTGEYLVSMMEKGGIRQMGDDLWLLDTGATGHFTHDPRLLENYAECSRVLRCAGGKTFPIVGTGTLRLSLRSGEGVVCVTLMNVAHVPGLSHNLLSLRRIADAGNKYIGTREGIRIVFAKSGDELFAPSCGSLNGLFGYRTDRSSEENLHAVIAPGARPTPPSAADINEFHCSHGHMHADLLRKTAKQMGVKLQGQLVPCQGCSEAKGIRKPVKPFTYTRVTKPAERCFVVLSGPKSVKSMGGKEYMMIVRDDYSRFTRVFFLRTKDETATYFSKYLAEIAPRKVEVVRSDGGGEFLKGAFGALCTTEKIRQEFTTADSPQYNGVAERQIAIIEAAGLAARIQAAAKYPNESFSRGESLWAEQAHWACHALNCTATSANPGYKSPHEM